MGGLDSEPEEAHEMTTTTHIEPSSTEIEPAIGGLYATTPVPLPFAPSLAIRAFLLERERGNLLVYSTGGLDAEVDELRSRGGVARHYLNHWHESLFGLAPEALSAKLVHHRAEAARVAKRGGAGKSFSRRHNLDEDFEAIPTPGHTAGATAYLWDTGEHRLLFTGDTIYLDNGEWVAAVLDSSDREGYIASLELIRELDFDLLVPWAASVDGPYLAPVAPGERRARVDAIIDRLRRGEDR
jgi:glyoxylase-like metal-dependent hydrolase (beta-lactamase superfamily II)